MWITVTTIQYKYKVAYTRCTIMRELINNRDRNFSWQKQLAVFKIWKYYFAMNPRYLFTFVWVCWDYHKKITDWVLETIEIYFFTVLEAKSPRSLHWQVWFLLRPLSLVHRFPRSCSVLSGFFFCAYTFLLSLGSSQDTSCTRLTPSPPTISQQQLHFNLITTSKNFALRC